MKELQYLNKYFLKYKYHFIAGIIITIIAQIFALYPPRIISESIQMIEALHLQENQTETNPYKALLLKLLMIIGATLISGFFTFWMRQTLIVMSRHIEFDLKNEVFQQYTHLSQNFYKKNKTGDLMNRISEDVSKVRMYVGPALMYAINTSLRFIIIILYMYNVSPELTLYTLLPLPLLSFVIFKLSQEINRRSTLFQQKLSELSSFTQELFSGIRVVKAHAIEEKKNQSFEQMSEDNKKTNLNLTKVNALFGPLMILLIGLSNLVVIFTGGKMYIDGQISSIGIIAEFIIYINMLTWPVASIGWVSSMVQEAAASQKRINEFLKIQPEIVNTPVNHGPIKGNVRFENISFTYEDTGIKALNNVSFELNAGQSIAILGDTGAGKSTILNLLSRLYNPDSGTIYIDNLPIEHLNLEKFRKSIGVVPQESFLFSESIADNIRFGKNDATDEEIIHASKIAAVHDSIERFDKKYQTILGERGITISGGQRQRICIARALIKNPSILILDDSLSAVDTETEETILENLKDFSSNRTTFMVTHRVSAARHADVIIILKDGSIIQQGDHESLINTKGYYQDLYYKQLQNK